MLRHTHSLSLVALSGLILAALPATAPAQGTSTTTGGSFGNTGSSGGNSLGGGNTGSSGGNSMSGGSSSGNFLGNSGGSLSSGFNLGTGNTGNTGTTGNTGRSGVGSSTFLGPYYANPIAMGIAKPAGSTTTTTATFGTPLYTLQASTTTTQTYNIPGRSNTNTQAVITAPNTINGLGTGWQQRRPVIYRVSTDIPKSTRPAGEMRSDLQAILGRSSRLSNPSGIRVVMDGSTVVLQGSVRSQSERRLAEGLVRLERGVDTVRNELKAPAETTE